MAELVSLVIGVLGVAGIIFTALRWRRDDTTAVVTQQGMLFEELRVISEALRTERDGLRVALEDCVEGR